MRFFYMSCFILLMIFTLSGNAVENSTKGLKKQVLTMLTELQSKKPADIEAFIKKYALPLSPEKKFTNEELDQIVKMFMKKKQDVLVSVLQQTKKLKPVVTENGTVYTFNLKESASHKNKIIFVYSSKNKLFLVKN